ncbi:kinesin-like protein KIF21A isoform X1 [Drosophila elegans]|uniref:kinesin-like protein KIF21A isoform X1 n=1 Tax=Drosophila elegans TaxID=30023 RepID=UPI0007E7B461|nr:kinesin-like protein KIF21A isoform X1 [Drosophila elegans]XP_017121297.1 kinesin-like protein KIF21A isoform X1 [Drosophila elegans]XP_041566445.1 kinesin-like protein KIF21A isoform X1 [Drosophila elegans]XP_041566446.1 kinesin-like protein KIF21A isoform X1 [Drosophila elegans]
MISEVDLVNKDSTVRVAVRIRPLNSREQIDMCRVCTTVTFGEPQIFLGSDKAFTFDYVFDTNSNQCDIYSQCVDRLVDSTLHGYNATVLAYGQTGSGKTYTMGTGFDHESETSESVLLGIIPRAVRHIFSGIEQLQACSSSEQTATAGSPQFSLAVQYIELYNEDIFDLLDPFNKNSNFKIHEDANGQITISGASIKPIFQPQDALKYLQQGALARTTASTKMNDQSSRSHALFTIFVRRQRLLAPNDNASGNDLETLTSKFHFVDLAGSERLKRTQATGERAREGISINCGLLALGNCISALGDTSKRALHVPYRDSKLTRLLQDSLGGNSQTLMIACVSPSDRDFMETLNTLKYANRARNIKNKVKINQDQSSRTISQLRREIAALQMELLEYKQGKLVVDCEGNTTISDTFNENMLLLSETKRLQQRLKSLQNTVGSLTERNAGLKLELDSSTWSSSDGCDVEITKIVGNYMLEIEQLQAKLIESEELRKQMENSAANSPRSNKPVYDGDIISKAKKGLEKERELLMSRSLPGIQNQNVRSEEADAGSSDSEEEGVMKDLEVIDNNIVMKTKLIEQLELTHERMELMRMHYEEKLSVLNCKIVNTQKERDDVLTNMESNWYVVGSSATVASKDSLKKVKSDYEGKLSNMQQELKKLQNAQREHLRQQQKLKSHEVKIGMLRNELHELKFTKVKLMKKMSEQTSRHKEEDSRKSKEIAQLLKDQRRQINAVLSLEAKMSAKEQILKRKTEEVIALRKSQRGKSGQRAAPQLTSKITTLDGFTSRAARHRWENLYRTILHAARNRQLITQLEKELERLISEREDLSRDLNIMETSLGAEKRTDDFNEVDNIKTNIRYIQENIEHVQQAIMEFEDSKDTVQSDVNKIQALLDEVSTVAEAKFLLQKFSDTSIVMSCNLAIAESHLQEHESLLKEVKQESAIQQQILQHFLSQNSNVHISDIFDSLNLKGSNLTNSVNPGSQKSLLSNATYDIPQDDKFSDSTHVVMRRTTSRSPSPFGNGDPFDKSPKVRRRTAKRTDLLFGDIELPEQTINKMT